MRFFDKRLRALGATLALLAVAALPGRAADFVFTGTLTPAQVGLFSFSVTGSPFTLVTLGTTSYAAGGFDPVLSLFRGSDGLLLDANDDGPASVVPADPITGFQFDSYFEIDLEPGDYLLALTYSPDLATSAGRTSSFAVGIQNVTSAAEVVPEPGTVALFAAGLLPLAGKLRRRRA